MHRIGNKYKRVSKLTGKEDIYLLCTTCFYDAILINIETGRCWRTSTRVSSINEITQEEFEEIAGEYHINFEKI